MVSGEGCCWSTKLSGHAKSPDASMGLPLPSCCRLSEEGVDPGDLSLLPLGEEGLLYTLCFRVKWFCSL